MTSIIWLLSTALTGDDFAFDGEFVGREAKGLFGEIGVCTTDFEEDASFFDDNVLAVGYVYSPSTSYDHEVTGVTSDGSTVTVGIKQTAYGLGDMAVSPYAVLAAVPRDVAAGAASAVFPVTKVTVYYLKK